MADDAIHTFEFEESALIEVSGFTAKSIHEEAALCGTTPDQVVQDAIRVYIQHAHMLRAGWEGPAYRRITATHPTTVLMTKLGMLSPEEAHLSLPVQMPKENQE